MAFCWNCGRDREGVLDNYFESQEVQPIRYEACPSCGYSLQGTPEATECPECGYRWDFDNAMVKAYWSPEPKDRGPIYRFFRSPSQMIPCGFVFGLFACCAHFLYMSELHSETISSTGLQVFLFFRNVFLIPIFVLFVFSAGSFLVYGFSDPENDQAGCDMPRDGLSVRKILETGILRFVIYILIIGMLVLLVLGQAAL